MISRLFQRYQQSGSTADRQRSDRPRITSAAEDRCIRVLHKRNRTVTARATASNVPGIRRISAQTVRNRLRENGLRPRCPYFGAVMRRRHRLTRVRRCDRIRGWDLQNWRRVWFSHESRFMLQKTCVYRCQNERFARNCVLEVDNFSEEVWWCVVSYFAPEKRNWCTSPATLMPLETDMKFWHMLPAMNLRRKVFQHDNARPHSARATVDFLANHNVTVLPWPSKSPYWNPIEHLWDDLDWRVRSCQTAPQILQELQQAL